MLSGGAINPFRLAAISTPFGLQRILDENRRTGCKLPQGIKVSGSHNEFNPLMQSDYHNILTPGIRSDSD